MTDNEKLIAEARGFAGASDSARATLLRDLADALERECKRAESLAVDLDARWEHSDHLTAKYYRRMRAAERALELAEKAHASTVSRFMTEDGLRTWVADTPTDDEREALELIAEAKQLLSPGGYVPPRVNRLCGRLADALEARIRRSEVPEPSADDTERTCVICGRTDIVADDMPFDDNGTAWEDRGGNVICTRCDPTRPPEVEPQVEPSDAEVREVIRQTIRGRGEGEVYADTLAGVIARALAALHAASEAGGEGR